MPSLPTSQYYVFLSSLLKERKKEKLEKNVWSRITDSRLFERSPTPPLSNIQAHYKYLLKSTLLFHSFLSHALCINRSTDLDSKTEEAEKVSQEETTPAVEEAESDAKKDSEAEPTAAGEAKKTEGEGTTAEEGGETVGDAEKNEEKSAEEAVSEQKPEDGVPESTGEPGATTIAQEPENEPTGDQKTEEQQQQPEQEQQPPLQQQEEQQEERQEQENGESLWILNCKSRIEHNLRVNLSLNRTA